MRRPGVTRRWTCRCPTSAWTGARCCSRRACPATRWARRSRPSGISSGSAASPPRRRNCCWPRRPPRSRRSSPRWPWPAPRRPAACSAPSTGTGGRLTPGSWCSARASPRAGVPRRCSARPASWPPQLDGLGSVEAPQVHLLAGRIALRLGRADESRRQLTAAARSRRRGPAYSRAAGWLAEALLAETAVRSAPAAARVPPRPRPAGRAPAHAGRLGAARPGHRGRRRAGRAGPAGGAALGPVPVAAALERALAGHRAGRAPGPARR